jgi:endonuclease/exonuclease/phosphatase family metal-dependent hydrolase
VRLATFNLLHGQSLLDGKVDMARLRAAVAALDADVLGLQEADREQPRSGGRDLTAEAAAALGGATYRFAAATVGTPERWRAATGDEPAGGPAYGVGLVSRLPVRRWVVTRLPAAPTRSPVLAPWPSDRPPAARLVLLRDEPRVVLAAVLDGPAGPLTVATTHLSFVPGWNVLQLWRAVWALRELPSPRILLGDLNLPGALPYWLTGWRRLAMLPTYPTGRPWVQIDHVLACGALPPVVSARSLAAPLSDHRPLLVELADPPDRPG